MGAIARYAEEDAPTKKKDAESEDEHGEKEEKKTKKKVAVVVEADKRCTTSIQTNESAVEFAL